MATSSTNSDFTYLMDREGVPKELVDKFIAAGISSVRVFAAFAQDTEELRKILLADFELDTTALAGKVVAGKVVVAWELAKVRSAKMAEVEAESELRQEAKPLRQSDFKSMKESYEAKWWKLEKKQIPSRAYVEKLGDGVEKGEPRAELLTEVTNCEEGDTDLMKAVFDSSGNIKAIKTTSTIALPKDPEELRARIALLGRAWCFISFQQPNCAWLKDLNPQIFQEYVDYLLGPFVFKLFARDEYGNQSAAPPWNLLLSYELEIRRKTMCLITEGSTLGLSLKTAYQDPVTKERYFNTPLALAGTLRSAKRTYNEMDNNYSKGGKGKGKGKSNRPRGHRGKAGGKGGNRAVANGDGGSRDGCKAKTPDGKMICYAYNTRDGCDRNPCRFLHVCGNCFRDHPMTGCSN